MRTVGVRAERPEPPANEAVVSARAVGRRYGAGDAAVDAPRGVSVEIATGRLTAVMGPSGSGKSTLMHILAGLDRPTAGGQQQFVAVARALVSRPSVMFADEPTGNLDSTTSGEILTLLRRSVDTLGQTTVMVTHDAHAAAIADRHVRPHRHDAEGLRRHIHRVVRGHRRRDQRQAGRRALHQWRRAGAGVAARAGAGAARGRRSRRHDRRRRLVNRRDPRRRRHGAQSRRCGRRSASATTPRIRSSAR